MIGRWCYSSSYSISSSLITTVTKISKRLKTSAILRIISNQKISITNLFLYYNSSFRLTWLISALYRVTTFYNISILIKSLYYYSSLRISLNILIVLSSILARRFNSCQRKVSSLFRTILCVALTLSLILLLCTILISLITSSINIDSSWLLCNIWIFSSILSALYIILRSSYYGYISVL